MINQVAGRPSGAKVIVGVDTHKYMHVAVAIDTQGVRLSEEAFAADARGYRELIEWSAAQGPLEAFGIEGTGSYGAGLASAVRRAGYRSVEVNRSDRRSRRAHGKTDTVDAEAAARSVLAGQSAAIPKSANGRAEMMRQIKIARDTAVKARTTAMITLKQIVVNAPCALREELQPLSNAKLIKRCARLRLSTSLDSTTASAKHSLRCLARRWQALAEEIKEHNKLLDQLTMAASPTLREGVGIGPDTAAAVLIVLGDNPERIRSEAAFAKLCGACPIPASSGMSNRHRLYRGGHRQANAALYRAVVVRMRFHEPTIAYVERRRAEGLSKREIIRCLKRYLAREIYKRVMMDHRNRLAAHHADRATA